MTLKNVYISALMRDPEGNIIGADNATGQTEDEGVTCVVPVGYLSNITTVLPADITVTLIPLPSVVLPTGVLSRVDDVEAETTTVVFAYPEA